MTGESPAAVERRLRRFLTVATLSVSLIVAVAFPSIYFMSGYRFESKQASHHAALAANAMSRLVAASPNHWRFQIDRAIGIIEGLHDKRMEITARHRIIVRDLRGDAVLRVGRPFSGPSLTRSTSISDGIANRGTVDVRASLSGLIAETAGVAILGLVASLALFLSFWRLPKIALRPLLDDIAMYRDRLERANADLQGFVYVISHDLKSPLHTIKLFEDLLHRRYGRALDEQGEKMHGLIVKGIERIESRLGGLGEYAGLHRNRAFDDIDAEGAVRDVMTELAADVEASGARIAIGKLPPVAAIPLQFRTLLQNLIGNALKYRHPDRPPMIAIDAAIEDASWHLTVADNGIGIPPDARETVFQLFARLHPPDTYPGTGMGLALCKRVADNHGGRIWVDSQPEQGSVFHVVLPVRQQDALAEGETGRRAA